MTTYTFECLHCEKEWARHDSKFCSTECRDAYAKTMPFVLTCWYCDADEGIAESQKQAEFLGWRDIEADPEGSSWNYIGYCPGCQKERRAER